MFQSKKRKALQPVITAIQNDLANNYKDNAVEGIRKLKDELENNGSELKPKELQELQNLLMHFEEDVRNFKRTY